MTTVPSLLIPCGYTCLPYRVKMGVLHVPVWQLPRFPLQAVLSGAFGVEQTPVLVLHVPAVWQVAGDPQLTGFDPVQVPLWHVSVRVQALPSLQLVPLLALVAAEQVPVDGLQVPATLQVPAVQVTGFDPVQVPPWQVSVCVHMLPSLQIVPLVAFVGVEQTPVVGLHVPATWQVGAVQVTGLDPVQVPLWQVSVCVQALPSLQIVPLVALVGVGQAPVAGLHVPATLQVGAVQVIVGPGTHAPDWQASPTVQELLSLQVVPLVEATQAPVVIEQTLQVPHAAPAFCQAPFASQLCGWLRLQVLEPGTQDPVHVPLAALQT
jgi:hypothetical protein